MAALDRFGVRYLIVGGIALGLHSEPRYTKDIDVLVRVTAENLGSLLDALREFGAPLHLIRQGEFLSDDFVFFFGEQPWRVDILTSIPGLDFEEAYRERVQFELGGRQITCISKPWLIRAKLASGRYQDLADVEVLRKSDAVPPN